MEKLKFMAKGQKLIRLEIKPIYSGVRNYMEAEFILNHRCRLQDCRQGAEHGDYGHRS